VLLAGALSPRISRVSPAGATRSAICRRTVTDPAGKWKKFTSDAFGNLTQVNEPNAAGGADYVTTYTYNLHNQLTGVSMPRPTATQTSTFN
jgi:hypothetical protein